MSELPQNNDPIQGAALHHAQGLAGVQGSTWGAIAGALFGLSWGAFSKSHMAIKGGAGALLGLLAGGALSSSTWARPPHRMDMGPHPIAAAPDQALPALDEADQRIEGPAPQFAAKLQAERSAAPEAEHAM